MSQTYSESEVAETQPRDGAELAGEPSTLALSADDFSGLEERILRAVNLVKRERMARVVAEERAEHAEKQAAEAQQRASQAEKLVGEAEQRATQAEARMQEQQPVTEQLKNEMNALRAERDQVRQRVERLLSQLDTLEL